MRKLQHALFYFGDEGLSEARDRAIELRANKQGAHILDAWAFRGDKETCDYLEFFGVPADLEDQIRKAHGEMKDPTDPTAVEIPEGYEDLGWAELQALATSVSDGPIRSKEDAIEAIKIHLASNPAKPVEKEAPAKSRRSRR